MKYINEQFAMENGPFTDDLLSEFPFQMVVFDSKLLDCSEGNLNISSLLN